MKGSQFARATVAPDGVPALARWLHQTPVTSIRREHDAAPGTPRAGRVSIRRFLMLGALTAVVGVLLIQVVDGAHVRSSAWQLVRQPALLVAFLVSYSAAFWLRATAWRRLLSRPPGAIALFEILQVALFANHLLPLKAGEVVRPYLLVRQGVGAIAATTTTLVARLLDFVVLLTLARVLLPLSAPRLGPGLRMLALPLVIVAVGCAAVLWLRASSTPLSAFGPFARVARAAGESLRSIPPTWILRAVMWTVPSWVLEGAAVQVAARATGAALPVQAAVAVTAVTILFQLVHVTPGGIGVYEASMTAALALYGIPPEQGLTLAVLTHGMKFAYAFAIGGLCTALAARDLARSRAA
jgi:uncharacterized membrane protein YbhN (UPF0104 family)